MNQEVENLVKNLEQTSEQLLELDIGTFEILKKIAKGGQGRAILAKQISTDSQVVIKEISCIDNHGNFVQKIKDFAEREIENHKKMDFQLIVKFIDSSFKDNKYYIIIEYCEKGSLGDMINEHFRKKERFEEEVIWDYLAQIALGVNYLHIQKVVHKDLNPNNIFLTDEGQIRIGDLGLSKMLDGGISFSPTLVGTMDYYVPEHIILGWYKYSGDVWQIGLIIYNLLTFKDAFHNPYERIALNSLLKLEKMKKHVRDHAQKLLQSESSENAKEYLRMIIEDIDRPLVVQQVNSQPLPHQNIPIDPKEVKFEIKNPYIAKRSKAQVGSHLDMITMLMEKNLYVTSLLPVIFQGDGVVRIEMKFEDPELTQEGKDRGCRWIGIVNADFDIPDSYYPGVNGESIGYSGSDGSIVHLNEKNKQCYLAAKQEEDKAVSKEAKEEANKKAKSIKFIDGNDKFENGEVVIAEINMPFNRQERTLHFFVKGKWQPVSIIGLPDSVKFIFQRRFEDQSVKIISMRSVPKSSVVYEPLEQNSHTDKGGIFDRLKSLFRPQVSSGGRKVIEW
ncbi:MAG: putative AGC family protein kinase [Streblomastix strix]|uniref:non-specific serine/threonine protein kinase n=1 Tax=Streblomastix strix TaxID=222440 RepID=A0A5J4W6H4_9EUKA|nr:MAG: putative AGC family protein kinase [Streblomastix strix]